MKYLIPQILILATLSSAWAKPIPKNEMVTPLLEGTREVSALDQLPTSGETKIDLWSGSYWPQYQGSLGVRYRDQSFARFLKDEKVQFKTYKEIKTKTPLYSFYGQEEKLSPAEKYDLLVGDTTMSLTKYAWSLGDDSAKLGGKVPLWRGICDGWASASQKMPRPTKTVTLQAPNGTPITFFPEDIKAIGSLSYARSQSDPIFLGKRCLSAALFFTDACAETNPGTFHKAVTNRVGRMGKTFIADVSPGSEVWNYPVHSFSVSYYNVFSEEESPRFQDVMEVFNKKFKFSKTGSRDPRTAYIVGVTMKVNYKDMRPANLLTTDSKEQDKLMEKVYEYDLELDSRMNILGGESVGMELPDFIWAPQDQTYPKSEEEEVSTPRSASEVAEMARLSSAKGQPLSVIVKQLFELSK